MVGVAAVVLAVAVLVGACGDDGGADDHADEASFCRLAIANEPVDEASASVLVRLEDLAPDEVSDAIEVLRELAEEVESLGPDDPATLTIEFERRFDPDFVAARSAVAEFVDEDCPRPTTTTSSPATTSSSTSTPTSSSTTTSTTSVVDRPTTTSTTSTVGATTTSTGRRHSPHG